jgi:hypothetical protein
VGVDVTASNAAPVQFANGADRPAHAVSGSDSLGGGANVTGSMALSASNTHTLLIDTSTPDSTSGALSVTSSS